MIFSEAENVAHYEDTTPTTSTTLAHTNIYSVPFRIKILVSVFVLTRQQNVDDFQLRCYFAHVANNEAFQSTVRYLQQTFTTTSPIIQQSHDDTLGDGILFAFFFAAFLDEPADNVHEAASAFMTQAQTLCEDILREATAHSVPNINIIFARNDELKAAFYDLFIASSHAFAQTKHVPTPLPEADHSLDA